MNLDTQYLSHKSSLNRQDRRSGKPTNEDFDKKFIDVSDKLDQRQEIRHPTKLGLFTMSTTEFKSVKVTVKDAYKDQLIRQKRQEFIDLFFDAVGTATGKPVSPNEKKYYGEQLKPAADICFELFDKTQWEDDDLRFAWITLKYFSKNVNFATDEKEVIKGLLTRLSDAAPHLRLGAQNEPQ